MFNKNSGVDMAMHQSKLPPQQSANAGTKKAFFDACTDSSIPVSVLKL
jgi:hypothetical protein